MEDVDDLKAYDLYRGTKEYEFDYYIQCLCLIHSTVSLQRAVNHCTRQYEVCM